MLTKIILAASLASTLAFAATDSAQAQVRGVITIGTPPPPLRTEVTPPPRRGYQWVPGYWGWQGRRHVWHGGTWVRARPGYVYSSPAWVERGGKWQYQQGRWGRGDRDHDGVPNAVDRRPNDPNRR